MDASTERIDAMVWAVSHGLWLTVAEARAERPERLAPAEWAEAERLVAALEAAHAARRAA